MSSSTVVMQLQSGVLGQVPGGQKLELGRVDFRSNEFFNLIETKGYRIAWSRAALCPCTPNNDQTEQPRPTCDICRGSGWLYFPPDNVTTDEEQVGELGTIEEFIVNDQAAVVRAIMSGITSNFVPYDVLAARLEGTAMVTVRPENRLGYHDRLINLDTVITFSEVLTVESVTVPLKTRYPVIQLNLLRSESAAFTTGTDFTIDAQGRIAWEAAGVGVTLPMVGDLVVVHYLCHPVWLIVEHPHALRASPIAFKQAVKKTPVGNDTPLPLQCIARYEFLPDIRS